MKKLFLAITVIGLVSLTSCKKEETKVEESTEQTTEETTTATEETTADDATAIAGVEIPEFSTPEIQEFAKEYATYFQEVMDATKSGDATKASELQAQAVEWTKKASEWTQKMTPEDAQKFAEWGQKLATAAAGQ